jgi:GTPase SAR1 family protein
MVECAAKLTEQELGSMYDYLAKIILLGPSGSGKCAPFSPFLRENKADEQRSCLLHRFVKNEWRVLTSQTIGVEFASKIIKVGSGARRKRIKLQVSLFPLLPLSSFVY